MAGDLLAAQQTEQANRISDEIVRQSVEHQQSLQASAERKWQNAHQTLVQIVLSLDPDYYDACQKSGHAIEHFDDEVLHHWIQMRVKAMQNRLHQLLRPDPTLTLRNSLEDALRNLEASRQEEGRLTALIRQLQIENEQLVTHIHASQQIKRPISQPVEEVKSKPETPEAQLQNVANDQEPDWMREWRAGRTFQRESAALVLIGETGKSLRPNLVDLLAKKLNVSSTNSSLSETFNRLLSFDGAGGFIEVLEVFSQPGASTGGNHPDILRMTERGKTAYQFLTGKQPVENEYGRLIRKHKSPEHTVLNIQAAEALVELGGYQILDQAPEIQLPDGSVFIPDLVALDQKIGKTIFIEVERDTSKDRSTRIIKWKNLFNASNGDIYVVCDNISCERAIQVEINQGLGESKFNSYLTNLNSLWKGKRGQDGGIWLSVRRARWEK